MTMILFEKNNGTWKIPPDIFGKAFGVWHSLGEGSATLEPFNEALKLVGLPKADTLDVVLTSSEMCTALAGNADARIIMKDNYTADMTSAIGDNFNDGLNLLNYQCGLKCYLINGASLCENITGGYQRHSNYQWTLSFNSQSDGMHITFDSYGQITSKNKVNMSRFGKLVVNGSGFDPSRGSIRIQSVAGYDGSSIVNLFSQKFQSATTSTFDITNITEDGYVGIYDWGSGDSSNYVITEMCMEPPVEDMVLYEAGKNNTTFTELCFDGGGSAITYNNDHIFIASNPNKGGLLQPYAAIVTPTINAGGAYKYVNVAYEGWTQSGTSSAGALAVLNDTAINQGSSRREFTNKTASKTFTDASGTVKLEWTDGKMIGIGCFSQSNQSCTMKITKIWLSDD